MLLMFFSFLNINVRLVFKYLHRYRSISLALLIIHLVSPILVFPLKNFLDPQVFVGLILASCATSGVSVIFLSKLFGGIEEEALVVTSISHLISPILIPALVFVFASEQITIDPFSISLTIIKLLILPMIAAEIASKTIIIGLLRKWEEKINMFLLFIIILAIVSPVRNQLVSNLNLALILVVIVLFLLSVNFFLGMLIGSEKKEKITYGVSTTYKNYALSTVLAFTFFGEKAALVPIIYAVCNNLFLIPTSLVATRMKLVSKTRTKIV